MKDSWNDKRAESPKRAIVTISFKRRAADMRSGKSTLKSNRSADPWLQQDLKTRTWLDCAKTVLRATEPYDIETKDRQENTTNNENDKSEQQTRLEA